ncbi:MAG: Gldg family protein [Chloroflexota bacterium]
MPKKQQTPSAKYAFIGLIVAAVACVASGLVGLFKGLEFLGIFSTPNPETWTLVLQISLGLVIIGLAAYAIMAPDTIRRLLTGRQARYGSNSLILSLAFLGILVVANYLAIENPKKVGDWTEDKSNTLAPETLQILSSLPGEVHAVAFYSQDLNRASAEELLLNFKTNSNGKFDYEFVDPVADPLAAREAGVTGDGKIMLTMGDRSEVSSFASETELARTLVRLTSPDARAVYFLQGHGEASVDVGDERSFSIAKTTLESKNYTVGTLNLAQTPEIPEDALAIIIAGPMKPITEQEASLLKDYVDAGGALVVMEDPIVFTEFGDSPDPLAEYLAANWGISLNPDVVIDLENSGNEFVAVSWQANSTHPITQNLTENYIVILPQARSITFSQAQANIAPTPILLTTERSWGETNLTSSETPDFTEGEDLPGPLTLAAAADNPDTGGRVVVFGNSVFASDAGFDTYGNGNVFINAVDWAAEQEDLLDITFREPTTRTFRAINGLVKGSVIIAGLCLLPGLVIVAGVTSWLARRRKG